MSARGPATAGRVTTPQHRRVAGYTLIEVIVAFAVLALGLSILLGILANATRQVRWADDAGRAALHAQSLLDQTGVGEPLVPGHQEGGFEDGRYRWTLDVAPWRDPQLQAQAPQPEDEAAPRLVELVLDVRWKDGSPRNTLRVQSLRLTQPDRLGGGRGRRP